MSPLARQIALRAALALHQLRVRVLPLGPTDITINEVYRARIDLRPSSSWFPRTEAELDAFYKDCPELRSKIDADTAMHLNRLPWFLRPPQSRPSRTST